MAKLKKEYGLKNNLADWNRFAKTHKKLLKKLRIPPDPLRYYSKKNVMKRRIKK